MELKRGINWDWIISLIVAFILGLAFSFTANAVTLLMVPQGGTGAGTFTAGNILQGNGTGAIQGSAMSGDATLAVGGALTIGANAIEESMLKAVDAPADEECLTYEATVGDFEWQACGGGGGGDFSNGGDMGGADRTLGNADNFDLGFLTNNINRLHIENDGDIGIGTTTPAQMLHMVGDGTAGRGWARFGLSTAEYTEIGHRGSNSAINAVGDGNLDFRHDGVTRASLTDAGVFTATTFSGALSGNATTATALAGNGANCGAGNYPLGVDASGAVEGCAADANTTYTAGRSLTLAGTTINADSEIYHHEKCFYIEDPVAADDLKSLFHFRKAATITGMWCESDQTVNMDLQLDDGTPADINGADLVCDSTPADDTVMGGDTGAAAGERLDLAITSVAGTPTWVSICFDFTYDD